MGTSTSGWKFKHPGRAGDSAVIGSGFYCDNTAGAAVASGDGEDILRSCLSFLVVEYMRNGFSPQDACTMGIKRLESIVYKGDIRGDVNTMEKQDSKTYPDEFKVQNAKGKQKSTPKKRIAMHEKLTVAVIAMNKDGEVGAGTTLCKENPHRGRPGFPYPVWKSDSSNVPASPSFTTKKKKKSKRKSRFQSKRHNNQQIIEYEVSRVE